MHCKSCGSVMLKPGYLYWILLLGICVVLVQMLLTMNRSCPKFIGGTWQLRENHVAMLQLAKKLENCLKTKDLPLNSVQHNHSTGFLRAFSEHKDYREITPFDSFISGRVYSVNKGGIIDEPSQRLVADRVLEREILEFGVNKDVTLGELKISDKDLVNGISRFDRIGGVDYDLIFKTRNGDEYKRVQLRRPFTNLQLVERNVETIDTSTKMINIILPLSGRLEDLKKFLERFGENCLRSGGRLFLTVVYFGKNDKDNVTSILSEYETKLKFTNYKLIFAQGDFSRGIGLQEGVHSWKRGNDIMFFCDVDMHFDYGFLDRCRFYTEPGRMVYYPVVFSLYNPTVVTEGNARMSRNPKHLFVLDKAHGYWRDYGFGMACMHKSDFLETGGFDTRIKGWGSEDVKLYRKFLGMKNLTVIRATDRGLFHIYHLKKCDKKLSRSQYQACLTVKGRSEGSKLQMTKLAFGSRLYSDSPPDWRIHFERMIKGGNSTNVLDIEISSMKSAHARLRAFVDRLTSKKRNTDGKDSKRLQVLDQLQTRLDDVSKLLVELENTN